MSSTRRREKFLKWKLAVREKYLGTSCGKGPRDRYRKFKYPNLYLALKAGAEIEAKGVRSNGEPNINPIHVYHCECCGGIHLGHLASGESILMMDGCPVNIRKLQDLAKRARRRKEKILNKECKLVALVLSLLSLVGCLHVNSSNPKVVKAALLLDAANKSKTLEDTLAATNAALENIQAQEPEYYAHVKPLLKKISSANRIAAEKIKVAKDGGSADWQGAIIDVGKSVTPADLTAVGFKNPHSQVLVGTSIALVIGLLTEIKTKFGGI